MSLSYEFEAVAAGEDAEVAALLKNRLTRQVAVLAWIDDDRSVLELLNRLLELLGTFVVVLHRFLSDCFLR